MTVLAAIVGLLILWNRASKPVDEETLHDYRQAFLDGVWSDEKSRLFIDSSQDAITYTGDVAFCGLDFDEGAEGAPKSGDEIRLNGVYFYDYNYDLETELFRGNKKDDFTIRVLWQVDDELARYVVDKKQLERGQGYLLPVFFCRPRSSRVNGMRRVPIEEWSRDGSTPDAMKFSN